MTDFKLLMCHVLYRMGLEINVLFSKEIYLLTVIPNNCFITTLKVRKRMGEKQYNNGFGKITFNKGQHIYCCTVPFDFGSVVGRHY